MNCRVIIWWTWWNFSRLNPSGCSHTSVSGIGTKHRLLHEKILWLCFILNKAHTWTTWLLGYKWIFQIFPSICTAMASSMQGKTKRRERERDPRLTIKNNGTPHLQRIYRFYVYVFKSRSVLFVADSKRSRFRPKHISDLVSFWLEILSQYDDIILYFQN